MGIKNQRAVYEKVSTSDDQVYEWVFFSNAKYYEWSRFRNTIYIYGFSMITNAAPPNSWNALGKRSCYIWQGLVSK